MDLDTMQRIYHVEHRKTSLTSRIVEASITDPGSDDQAGRVRDVASEATDRWKPSNPDGVFVEPDASLARRLSKKERLCCCILPPKQPSGHPASHPAACPKRTDKLDQAAWAMLAWHHMQELP